MWQTDQHPHVDLYFTDSWDGSSAGVKRHHFFFRTVPVDRKRRYKNFDLRPEKLTSNQTKHNKSNFELLMVI